VLTANGGLLALQIWIDLKTILGQNIEFYFLVDKLTWERVKKENTDDIYFAQIE